MSDIYKKVFSNQIWSYWVHDMNSVLQLVQKASRNHEQGGQNFTAVLATMSVIDFCAGYFLGKTEPTDRTDVAAFIKRYFQEYDSRFKDLQFSKQFYVVFRHGLSHQWSPKAAGVSMDSVDDILTVLTRRDGKEVPVLNFPPFFELVKKALKDYEYDLSVDAGLRANFDKRYDSIGKEDAKEASKFLRLLRPS